MLSKQARGTEKKQLEGKESLAEEKVKEVFANNGFHDVQNGSITLSRSDFEIGAGRQLERDANDRRVLRGFHCFHCSFNYPRTQRASPDSTGFSFFRSFKEIRD